MLSLAALRYRNVLAENGGPVTRIDRGTIDVRGRPLALANAYLTPGLLPDMRQTIYANAAGTGMHALPAVARYMAISESLERWAFHATVGWGGRRNSDSTRIRRPTGWRRFRGCCDGARGGGRCWRRWSGFR